MACCGGTGQRSNRQAKSSAKSAPTTHEKKIQQQVQSQQNVYIAQPSFSGIAKYFNLRNLVR